VSNTISTPTLNNKRY